MVCKNCGKEITENSKFCGYCGQSLEEINLEPINQQGVENDTYNNQPDLVSNVDGLNNVDNVASTLDTNNDVLNPSDVVPNVEGINNVDNVASTLETNNDMLTQPDLVSNVEGLNNVDNVASTLETNNDMLTQPDLVSNVEGLNNVDNVASTLEENNDMLTQNVEPIQTQTEQPETVKTESSKSEKKKSKNTRILLIILAVILVIAINVFAFMSMNKSSKSNISVLEKAVGNFKEMGNESGTIVLGLRFESSTSDIANLSARFLFQKENDEYKFNVKLDKSSINEEIDLYSVVNKDKANVYVNSKTFDMMGLTASDVNTWLVYSQALDEINNEIEKVETEENNIKINEIIDENHFKFIEKTGDLNHYKLVIDEALFESLKNKLELSDEVKTSIEEAIESLKENKIENIEIDIYINKSNEIAKIEMDLAKMINSEDIKSAVISIEFKDFNNTKIEIPKEALNSTMTIEDYTMQYGATPEIDLDSDMDMGLDTNMDTDLDFDTDESFDYNF